MAEKVQLGTIYSFFFGYIMEEALDELIGKCAGAAILSLSGIVWYSTPGFYTNPNEFQSFANIFQENSPAVYKGLSFQNQIYLTLLHDENRVTATTNTSFIILCKCNESVLFVYDENKTSYEKCTKAAEEVAQKIKDNKLDLLDD